ARGIMPIYALAIEVTWPHVREVLIPDLVRVCGQLRALRFTFARATKKTELPHGRICRADTEVYPCTVPGSTQGERKAGFQRRARRLDKHRQRKGCCNSNRPARRRFNFVARVWKICAGTY